MKSENSNVQCIESVCTDDIAAAVRVWERCNVAASKHLDGIEGARALRVNGIHLTVIVIVDGDLCRNELGVIHREPEHQVVVCFRAVARLCIVAVDGDGDRRFDHGVKAPGIVQNDDKLPRALRGDKHAPTAIHRLVYFVVVHNAAGATGQGLGWTQRDAFAEHTRR